MKQWQLCNNKKYVVIHFVTSITDLSTFSDVFHIDHVEDLPTYFAILFRPVLKLFYRNANQHAVSQYKNKPNNQKVKIKERRKKREIDRWFMGGRDRQDREKMYLETKSPSNSAQKQTRTYTHR